MNFNLILALFLICFFDIAQAQWGMMGSPYGGYGMMGPGMGYGGYGGMGGFGMRRRMMGMGMNPYMGMMYGKK